jgi:hypothetical protein
VKTIDEIFWLLNDGWFWLWAAGVTFGNAAFLLLCRMAGWAALPETMVFALVAVSIAFFGFARVRWGVIAKPRCARCGYSPRGLYSANCPECGSALSESGTTRAPAPPIAMTSLVAATLLASVQVGYAIVASW